MWAPWFQQSYIYIYILGGLPGGCCRAYTCVCLRGKKENNSKCKIKVRQIKLQKKTQKMAGHTHIKWGHIGNNRI